MADAPLAFVAMQFDDDPWKDKRYVVIRDVAEEAGYRVLRADEISTSGPVVDEVCQYFRESELVILDTTGDSLSVSYELGYCHGIERDPAHLILLRKSQGRDIPFNYRHFRFQCYRDLRHLRRLLREWFGLLQPLSDDTLGYGFPFSVGDDAGFYGRDIADVFLRAFSALNLAGRIEYYAGDPFVPAVQYVVGIGHRPIRKKEALTLKDWHRIADFMRDNVASANEHVALIREYCELGDILSLRSAYLYRGAAEFKGGEPQRIIKRLDEDAGNWSFFLEAVVERIESRRAI